MQISIPLDRIQFEVRDGKIIFAPSESVELAKFVLDAIGEDLKLSCSKIYEILNDREMISNAMQTADCLDCFEKHSADMPLADNEIGILESLRRSGSAWIRSKAGQILAQDAGAR